MITEDQSLDVRFFSTATLTECWIHSREGHTADVGALENALDILKTRRLNAVWMRLFGDPTSLSEASQFLQHSAIICPPVLIVQDYAPPQARFQLQLYAVSGVQTALVYHQDTPIGLRFEDEDAAYCLLRLLPEDAAADKVAITRSVFDKAHSVLAECGGRFGDTVRTWLFADRILTWYEQLNIARNRFFAEQDIYGHLVPASTGVGTANLHGSPLAAQLLAVWPKNGSLKIAAVPSPLQCPALDYKSSFSRAVKIQMPARSRLYISGTASIDRTGKTAFVGDVKSQIDLTMQVAGAILKEAKMNWADAVNALVYFKHQEDFGLFDDYCRRQGLEIPHLKVVADVCRPELLFEIEVESLSLLSQIDG